MKHLIFAAIMLLASLQSFTQSFDGVSIEGNISNVINEYKNKGYITTQVYVKEQNINSGILTFTANEGIVEEIKAKKILRLEESGEFETEKVLNQLKEDLKLKYPPHHIECFDNSNFQGTNAVAAMVCWK